MKSTEVSNEDQEDKITKLVAAAVVSPDPNSVVVNVVDPVGPVETVAIIVIRYIAKQNQALNVTYTCEETKATFRPFANKRYNSNFRPSHGRSTIPNRLRLFKRRR
jgi:hypothetical protein